MVRGFRTEGSTFLVLTNLAPANAKDAQELCHMAGSFIWANENRHFGLEGIKVVGAGGELLPSRFGLRGDVR